MKGQDVKMLALLAAAYWLAELGLFFATMVPSLQVPIHRFNFYLFIASVACGLFLMQQTTNAFILEGKPRAEFFSDKPRVALIVQAALIVLAAVAMTKVSFRIKGSNQDCIETTAETTVVLTAEQCRAWTAASTRGFSAMFLAIGWLAVTQLALPRRRK